MIEWRRIHVCGVAGVGMSALAQAALGAGLAVSGSDRDDDRGECLPVLETLARAGIRLFPQTGEGIRAGAEALVVSTAIEPDNPDTLAAAAAGIPILHRSELLAALIAGHRTLAVAGTCGKSTVTGMAGWILEYAGLDPTVVNGAAVVGWASETAVGNVRCGKDDLWLIEADESDRSLLRYRPDAAVITNLSADHFDAVTTRRIFESFREQVKGPCLGALDGAPDGGGDPVNPSPDGCRFRFRDVGFELAVPGRHNVENALHATQLCGTVGVPVATCADALRSFRGIHRRLETVARVGDVRVVDDYAHNPAKISAALDAMQPFARRMLVVWRPHGYGPLRLMLDALVSAFSALREGNHRLWLLPVYDAGGTADRRIGSEALAQRLIAAGVDVAHVADYDGVRRALRAAAPAPGDVVLVMGARDPHLPELARALAKDLADAS